MGSVGGGGVYHGGSVGGGVHVGVGTTHVGNVGGYGGYRGGYGGVYRGYGYGYGHGYGYYGGYYRPYVYAGFGLNYYGYWPWYGGYGYGYGYNYPYVYAPSYPAYTYPAYDSSPNATVVYGATQPAADPVYVDRPNPVVREYDQYGQQTNRTAVRPESGPGSGSPVYLIAFRDQVIRAATAYWVDGGTLHYITIEHEQKQAPLSAVDRELSLQLNRERRVTFALPAAQ